MNYPGQDILNLGENNGRLPASAAAKGKGKEVVGDATTGRARAGSRTHELARTTTHESTNSNDSGGSTGSGTGTNGITNLISSTKNLFNSSSRKRGSISGPDGGSSYAAGTASIVTTSPDSPSGLGVPIPVAVPASSTTVSNNVSSAKPSLAGLGSATSSSATSSAGPSTTGAIPSDRSPSGYSFPYNSVDAASAPLSRPSSVSATPQPASVPLESTPSGDSGSADLTGLAPGSQAYTQARLKNLPRLASYTVAPKIAQGSDLSRVETNGSVESTTEEDSTTSQSGTETEQETETDEESDDDDGDDEEHDEQDVQGGMQATLNRPALPTLNSRMGGLNRMATATGSRTPFSLGGGGNPFSGWTTFASSTPTPGAGPMRTARPQAGDNAAGGSYFDIRPSSSHKSGLNENLTTPTQTPRHEVVPPASASRTPAIPYPSSAISPPASRVRVEPRSAQKPGPMPQATPLRTPVSPLAGGMASRPSFYHRQSRSLVDLSDLNKVMESDRPAAVASRSPSRPGSSIGAGLSRTGSSFVVVQPTGATASAAPTSSPVVEEASAAHAPAPAVAPRRDASPERRPVRRQSLPNMHVDPPSYQPDDDWVVKYNEGKAAPTAREDEGREELPDYTCDVHIEGYVPRKMEFLKPGVQSKDRRWKRQYIILHGTSIKIYKADPRTKAVPGEVLPPSPPGEKPNNRPSFSSTSSKEYAAARAGGSSAASRRGTVSSMQSQSSTDGQDSEKQLAWNAAAQAALANRRFDPEGPVHVHRHENEEHGLASLQHAPSALLAKAGENRCLRHYTLQGAESGLAADYLKRRHVVRIRSEGEQFLIQAKDDRAVIDWIEALQAATNTALDLDVRPLPKFITLPRRRRRRRPADGTAAAGATAATAAPGGTIGGPASTNGPASMTDSSAANAVTARTNAMNDMLAEEQQDYLNGPGGGQVS